MNSKLLLKIFSIFLAVLALGIAVLLFRVKILALEAGLLTGNEKNISDAIYMFASEYQKGKFNYSGGYLASLQNDTIWLWTLDGLKVYTIGSNVVYYHTDICSNNAIMKMRRLGVIEPITTSTVIRNEWKMYVKTGDRVSIYLKENNDGKKVITEVDSFNSDYIGGCEL